MWLNFFWTWSSVSIFHTVVVWMSENVYLKLAGRRDFLNGDMIVDWFEFSNSRILELAIDDDSL